jgi:hypothetical protein
MPTGFTADICKGAEVSFEDFAMTCARAFGALYSMRDEPMDAPIPETFVASGYHADELEKAKARLGD